MLKRVAKILSAGALCIALAPSVWPTDAWANLIQSDFSDYRVREHQSNNLTTKRITAMAGKRLAKAELSGEKLSGSDALQAADSVLAVTGEGNLYTHQTLGTPDVKVGETLTTVTYPILTNTTDGQALELQGAFIRVILDTETGAVSQVLKRNTPVNALPSANVSIAEVASQLNRTFKHDFYRNAGYLPFKIDTLDMLKEGAWISSAGQTHHAYYFVANGTFPSVVTDQGVKGPTDSRLIVVDSNNGQVLFSASTRAHAFNVTGKVDVYREDPISTPTPDMNIDTFFIDNQNDSLYGKFAEVHNIVLGDAVETDYDFTYYGIGGFDEIHMVEANSYYFITRFGVYGEKLGQQAWLTPAHVEAYDFTGSFYDMANGQVHLLGTGIFNHAYDGDMTLHEYTHRMQDVKVGSSFGDFEPCSLNSNSTARALCEASADYQSSSYMRDRSWAEYASGSGLPYYRNFDNTLTIENWGGDEHDKGKIIAAALWDLRRKLGGQTVDKIALEMLSYLHSGITVDEFLEDALIPAANAVSGISNQYEEVVRRVFALRHIYGYQPSYTWTPIDGSYPELRDYADGVNDTQSYTVVGAANLNVVTDAYTRFDEYTTFEILDGSDNLVAGPFTKEEAMSLAVTVPGDTVKFKVVDTNPGDGLFGAGYRLMSIRAEDVSNNAPNNTVATWPPVGMEPFAINILPMDDDTDQDGDAIVAARVDFAGNSEDAIIVDTENIGSLQNFQQTCDNRVVTQSQETMTISLTDHHGAIGQTVRQMTVNPYDPPPYGGGGGPSWIRKVSGLPGGTVKVCAVGQPCP